MADQYRAWLRHHRLSAAESLQRVLERPFSSLMTWLVIGIALALPVGLSVTLDNAAELSARWESPTQISLFLHTDVDAAAAAELAQALERSAEVAQVHLVSRDDALAEFGALSGFAEVLAELDDNPLPNLLLVTPAPRLDQDAVRTLRDNLDKRDKVDEAVLDMQWLQRLNSLMDLGRRMVMAVGALLLVGVILILGNTIRLAIENRRDEIVIVKLVGGSNPFVRRPFLYTGLWYGVGGGLVAGLVVNAALWYLQGPVGELARLYQSGFELRGPGIMGVLNLVIIGGLLGLAGAWLAVSRHLAAIVPR
ncbi:ABC transporter permease [Mangrovimicrobium sediminis]|uniref:Cell division protein FtsX n=2 Tax=Mangrovimicrobium sediminis TaxID=2562682 RepID=A0A4Z0LZZ0_9GAMM|nr:ABC transporter permease [Haliea sp. SAOS-164]